MKPGTAKDSFLTPGEVDPRHFELLLEGTSIRGSEASFSEPRRKGLPAQALRLSVRFFPNSAGSPGEAAWRSWVEGWHATEGDNSNLGEEGM